VTTPKPGSRITFTDPDSRDSLSGTINRIEEHPERGRIYWTKVNNVIYPVRPEDVR
jgi:hypothetical protein